MSIRFVACPVRATDPGLVSLAGVIHLEAPHRCRQIREVSRWWDLGGSREPRGPAFLGAGEHGRPIVADRHEHRPAARERYKMPAALL